MFTKFEVGGIALSITAMAAALYLLTANSGSVAELAKNEDQLAQTGSVFVQGDNDAEALRAALVDATDASGNVEKMIIDDVVIGTGEAVKAGDTVTVHYVGTLQNGQEFDNSNKRGEAFTFKVGEGKVIKGWDEGIVGMQAGGKRILVIPADKAYGENGYGPIPGGATLVFAIDLMAIGE